MVVPRSEYERERDEVAELAVPLRILKHYKYIEEIGFKEQHILTNNVFTLIFVKYTPLPTIDELWEKMGCKRKATKDGYNLVDEPS